MPVWLPCKMHVSVSATNSLDAPALLQNWDTDTAHAVAGAVFNLATVVVFILGLFISLVINRWWSIRTACVAALPWCTYFPAFACTQLLQSSNCSASAAASLVMQPHCLIATSSLQTSHK